MMLERHSARRTDRSELDAYATGARFQEPSCTAGRLCQLGTTTLRRFASFIHVQKVLWKRRFFHVGISCQLAHSADHKKLVSIMYPSRSATFLAHFAIIIQVIFLAQSYGSDAFERL